MTRDEALEKLFANDVRGLEYHGTIVDALTTLGLLNLDEPKSPEDDLQEGVQEARLGLVDWDELATILTERNLKVVRA